MSSIWSVPAATCEAMDFTASTISKRPPYEMARFSCMPVLFAVMSIADCKLARGFSGRRFMFPMTLSFTFFSMRSGISFTTISMRRFIR